MKPKILVTGATGKVGSALVTSLCLNGTPVRAGVRSISNAKFIEHTNVEIAPLDFDVPETIAPTLNGIETLCLITPPHFKQVDWATLMIDKAKEAGVKRIVRLSVLAAAMEPGILLGRWHRTVERYLQSSGLDYTIVRPGPFMQNFFGMYSPQNGTYTNSVGEAKVNHIDVRDVAKAMAQIATDNGHNKQIYMLTGNEPISFNEGVTTISSVTGKTFSYNYSQNGAMRQKLLNSGKPEWLVGILEELFAAFSTGAIDMTLPTFKEITGNDPISFTQFVEDFSDNF